MTLLTEIREILEAYRKDCQRTDEYQEGGVHLSQEQTMAELLQAFTKAVEEVIGEDIKPWKTGLYNEPEANRNQLKATQRARLVKIVEGK